MRDALLATYPALLGSQSGQGLVRWSFEVLVVANLVVWIGLMIRYLLKVRGAARIPLAPLAGIQPMAGILVLMFRQTDPRLAALLIAAPGVVVWPATGFRPERMLDADLRYGEAASEGHRHVADRYQMQAVALLLVFLAVIFAFYWDEI